MGYYVFTFSTRLGALDLYDALEGVCERKLISTPIRLTSSCGLSVSTADYNAAMRALRGKSVPLAVYYYDGRTYVPIT